MQLILTFGPLPFFGSAWGGVCGFLAAAALRTGGIRPRWLVLLAVVGLQALVAALTQTGDELVRTLVLACTTGLAVHGIARLGDRLQDGPPTRDTQAARLAVAEERKRFSRDLHDLIGYNLSAITLKSELTRMLVGDDDESAQAELTDIVALSRQLLAEVRGVAHGSPQILFATEIGSVRGILAAAGVATTLDLRVTPLPPRLSTALGAVLREAVTNLLRHSDAEHCRISVTQEAGRVRLEVSNDGTGPSGDLHDGPRRGLRNLADRMHAVGGTLSVSIDEDGWFRLVAQCPLGPFGDAVAVPGPRHPPISSAGPLLARHAPRPGGSGRGAWRRRR
ncbi:sensor histidine kinase [Streptomyces polygonati]|uniref:Sensor histidine kinase n=1 Tax=Streptomyces polygonati TaxID=1617087 RepID=A0ABV8HN67_9ACTN